jgi:lipid II:glycine glycyltransferase (peptidoglycan interpeptide bridge formation enzyme)
LRCIWEALRDEWKRNGWKYIEIRPVETDLSGLPGLTKSKSFCLHRLDLQPSLKDLFRGFHKDCVRRKIRRAEREGLSYEEGRSEPILEKFYRLLVLTRRRQLTLPPPLAWFRNLVACMRDLLKIRLASKNGEPLAGILTLSYKTTLVFKYGCSDWGFNKLGGNQLLFWKAIQEAKLSGFREFDMGRSDWDTPGLIEFKSRWGAAPSTLTYWRCGALTPRLSSLGRNTQFVRRVLRRLPLGFLARAGTLLYKHAA